MSAQQLASLLAGVVPEGFSATPFDGEAATLAFLAKLRAEVERLKRDYEYDHKCLHEVRERCESWTQRAAQAEAELAKAKERLRSEAMDDYASIKDLQRELAELKEGAK